MAAELSKVCTHLLKKFLKACKLLYPISDKQPEPDFLFKIRILWIKSAQKVMACPWLARLGPGLKDLASDHHNINFIIILFLSLLKIEAQIALFDT